MRTLPAIAGAVVALFATSALQAIELGSLSTERTETGWTLDGADMTITRSKLLNPANFGPGGTVSESINITDISGEITYTVLSNFDVFFFGWMADAAEMHLTEDEGAAITLAAGYDAARNTVTGDVKGEPPFSGALAHPGWQVTETRLPALTAGHDARVIAPAEIEL